MDKSDALMLSGVVAFCADCGDDMMFVPVDDGCDFDGCEFCCTGCDAAVFLMQILENVASADRAVSRVA